MLKTIQLLHGLLILMTFVFLQSEIFTVRAVVREPTKSANPAAENAFAEAEQLRRQWNEKSLRAAVEKYEQAQSYWQADNNRQKEALALEKIAEVHAVLGENNDALSHYRQALKLSHAAADTSLEIETLNNLCSIYAFQGETSKALEHCNRALRLSRDTNDRRGEGRALNNIGESYYFIDLKKALTHFEQALTLQKAVADQRGQAYTLTNIGYVYTDWSDLQKAATYYSQALNLWPLTGDLLGEARTINALGVLHSKLGEKQKALTEHTRARELFRTIGNPPGELTSLTGIGYIYDSMGEKQKALEHYTEALSISRAVGQREAEMVLLIHAGNMFDALQKRDEALRSYEAALALSHVLGDSRMQAYSLNFIGEIREAAGNLNEALSYHERALSLSRKAEDKRGEASVCNHIGHIYERMGLHKSALKQYESALTLYLQTKDRQGEASTRYQMAEAYRDSGQLPQARSQIEPALKIIESLRTDVGSHELRVSYFASVQEYYSLYIDILMQMHKTQPAELLEAAAFEASGRARARNLIDLLVEARTDIYQSIEPALKEKENTLRQTLNAKSERQMRLLGGRYSEAEAAALENEISDLTFELEEVRAQIRWQSPRYAELIDPQPLSLEDVQKLLDDNTLLLEYALGEKHCYLWAVTKTAIKSYELADRTKIEESAQNLYGLLTARQFRNRESLAEHDVRVRGIDEQYWTQARELAGMILEPVSQQLGTKRLLIVADGALLLVPFSALPASSASNGDGTPEPVPLMLEHEIVNLPSVSALAILRSTAANRQPATKSVAVLADPIYERNDPRLNSKVNEVDQRDNADLYQAAKDSNLIDTGSGIGRLLGSAEEAEEIIRMAPRGSVRKALGFDANLDTAKDPELAQYRIVHFAAHGISNTAHPELSGIVLSLYDKNAQSRAGFLQLQEIYNLNLPVELVVLSACNTGVGKEVKGEGLIGLTRGFMYAGAAGVMSSLWRVDDDATAELMRYFYEGILKDGLPPAAALRKAQVKMWQMKRWHSPYYWAAFVLHGEYQQTPSLNRQQFNRLQTTAAVAGILVVSLLGFYVLWRSVAARTDVMPQQSTEQPNNDPHDR